MTLDEATATIRAAWRGLPCQEIPAPIAEYLIEQGDVYRWRGRLWCADGW